MRILILGANSDMAKATAAEFARQERADLILASRDTVQLEALARDLEIRCQVKVEAVAFDAEDYQSHAAFYNSLDPKPDGVILAFGYGGNQRRAQVDITEVERLTRVNYLGAVSILEIVAADMAARRSGFIIAVSSVAGLRGRKANYAYGASKAALTTFLSGLGQRLAKDNVSVLTVLPGFVKTKMTAGMDLPEKLVARPEQVGVDIHKAWKKGKSQIYTIWLWRWIMLIIRLAPTRIFNKMNF